MTFPRFHPSAQNRIYVPRAMSSWRSPDGAIVTIRSTRPDDAGIAQEFVRDLSPEARYLRFMGTVRELTPRMLSRFVRIDPTCEVALIAVTSDGGRQQLLGECRYAVCPGGADCEFAVAVLDAWQRRGLGQRLLSELIGIARSRGLRAMMGEVFTTNVAMLALARKLGFKTSASSEGWSIRRVSLALLETPPRCSLPRLGEGLPGYSE